MTDALLLSAAVFAGAVLGAAYIACLWWSVSRGLRRAAPSRWFVTSLFARVSITACCFYVMAREDWRLLLACLVGFWITRSAVLHLSSKVPVPAVAS